MFLTYAMIFLMSALEYLLRLFIYLIVLYTLCAISHNKKNVGSFKEQTFLILLNLGFTKSGKEPWVPKIH